MVRVRLRGLKRDISSKGKFFGLVNFSRGKIFEKKFVSKTCESGTNVFLDEKRSFRVLGVLAESAAFLIYEPILVRKTAAVLKSWSVLRIPPQ